MLFTPVTIASCAPMPEADYLWLLAKGIPLLGAPWETESSYCVYFQWEAAAPNLTHLP